jgi:uncharacterized damage-inducible protein DinB
MDPHVAPHANVLDDLHRQVRETIAPLSDDEINRAVPGLQNTVGILLRHIVGSERYWIGEIAGGRPTHRVRDAEFGHDPLEKAALLADLARAATLRREVLEGLTAPDLLVEVEGQRTRGVVRATRAFALIHATGHLSYHLGQLRYMVRLLQPHGT